MGAARGSFIDHYWEQWEGEPTGKTSAPPDNLLFVLLREDEENKNTPSLLFLPPVRLLDATSAAGCDPATDLARLVHFLHKLKCTSELISWTQFEAGCSPLFADKSEIDDKLP